ncbi:EAL domain-containing protein [uncultured Nitratireductor sp.]|uniref:EAL domain-containing protein n=1 Tax=uncultured Nitratireductor sp. TaxID=520953 RepID=UPI0025F5D3EB|nr:EAL domain-containing protein [uncultured Nitratireductor sp.]
MRKKILSGLGLFVVCGAAVGILAGAAAGHLVHRMLKRFDIQRVVSGYLLRADDVLAEAVTTLDSINQSHYTPCSQRDIENLQRVALNSRYLKSAGRRLGEHLICTGEQGRFAAPISNGQPDYVTSEGLQIFLTVELAQWPGSTGLVLARDSASVLISHAAIGALSHPGLKYSLFGLSNGNQKIQFKRDGVSRRNDLSLTEGKPVLIDGAWHEVVCSQARPLCVAAAVREERGSRRLALMGGLALIGLLAGAAGGLGLGAMHADRNSLANRFRKALRAKEVSLVYQPIVRLSDKRILSVEVLARWHLPDGSVVPPDLFVSAAEQAGYVNELTRYVLRNALEEAAHLLRGNAGLSVTINVAAADILDPAFKDFAQEHCRLHGVQSAQLGFEITERMTARIDELRAGIERLRKAGHYIYVDDFGVEYSSLSYLAALPLDGVKLDRSFTNEIAADGKTGIIARQITGLVSQLHMTMIVEGIETAAQADFFHAVSADLCGQGWYFGKPMDLPRLEEYLSTVPRPH